MSRTVRIVAVAGALSVLGSASVAAAQAMTIIATAFADRELSDLNNLNLDTSPIGIDECVDSNLFVFNVVGIPAGSEVQVLDYWRGEGLECNEASARGGAAGGTTTCDNIGESDPVGTNVTELRGLAYPITTIADCSAGRAGNQDFYALGVTAAGAAGEVGDRWGVLPIGIDTEPSVAPTSVRATDGDVRFGLSWESNESNLRQFRVYRENDDCALHNRVQDAANNTADDAEAEGLRPGVGDLAGLEHVGTANSTSRSTSIGADAEGIEYGNRVTLGVAAIDRARNVGFLATACVTRIETLGFCDAYEETEGEACPKCSIASIDESAGGGSPSPFAAVMALFWSFALLWRKVGRTRI